MATTTLFLSLLALLPTFPAGDDGPAAQTAPPVRNEIVMTPGTRITATTSEGTISITAVDGLTRSYTWEGATRSVEMEPRRERWYGSLGLYFPGPGDHWVEHHGITRGVVEEGQQHFKSVDEAMAWLKDRSWMPFVYRDDGLVVGWGKVLPRRQLNVEVWQILVDGKKPDRLPGSRNGAIVVDTVKVETPPLVRAVRSDDSKGVADLLARGADPGTRDAVGTPVLVIAARRGMIPVVEALLKKGAGPNSRAEDGSTALMEAAEAGRSEVARVLLAAGADVNATSPRGLTAGFTPLIVAAMRGRDDLVQVLLEKGADVTVRSSQGLTPLGAARMFNHDGIVQRLRKAGAKD